MGRLFVRFAFYDLFIAAQSLRAWARLSSCYSSTFLWCLDWIDSGVPHHTSITPRRGSGELAKLPAWEHPWGCRASTRGCLLIDDGVGVIKIRHEGVVWRRTEQSVGTGPRLCFFKIPFIPFFFFSFSTSVVVCLSDQCSTYAESCREGRREASMVDDDRRKRRVNSRQETAVTPVYGLIYLELARK